MKTTLKLLITILATLSPVSFAASLDPLAVEEFVQVMHKTHGFELAELHTLFAHAERSDRIIELMSRPAEKVKPWWQYRALFISDKRIRDGVQFWKNNQAALERAVAQYGVAAPVIVAIIGVETSYGSNTGNHRVIDALSTLAFHYPGDRPERAAYFRAQLEHFLLFSKENNLAPLSVEGSYAGAMGMPQFMPENYRKLAVDYDGDGVRDIWKNPADAIGSVANYLNHHGWLRDEPIMSRANVGAAAPATFAQDELKPATTLSALAMAGITPVVAHASSDDAAALYELEAEHGKEYWIGYSNFYVVSRYNPRLKYTMAVAQLAAAIAHDYDQASR